MSAWQTLGLPAEAWLLLFTLGGALILTAFFQGTDFGFLKTPHVPKEKRKVVLLSGFGIIFFLFVTALPVFPVTSEENNAALSVETGTSVDIRLSGTRMPSDDPRSNFERLRPFGANGDALFVFNTRDFGRFEFPPAELQKMAAVLAKEQMREALGDPAALSMSDDRLASLALARAAFDQRDYVNASLFYDYALSDLAADADGYESIHGMLTASLYGAGEHRKGLKFICEQYKKNPVRSSPFRHAVHAHIRRIALTESYASAEATIEQLRSQFECNFDDFSAAWIPIPLKFMEYLERGSRLEMGLDEVDRAQIRKHVHARVPFYDYLLLLEGGDRNFRAIVELLPESHVYDLALKNLAKSADAATDPTYLVRFVKTYPEDPMVPSLLLKAARSLYQSESETTLANFESVFEGSIQLVENEQVVDLFLKHGPKELTRELAETYLSQNDKGPNSQAAAGIVLAAKINDQASDAEDLSKLTAIMQDGSRESRRKIMVLEFRRHCEANQLGFENLDFGQVARRLSMTHQDFSNFDGTGFYEASTWLATTSYRSSIPCASSFGSGKATLKGEDMLLAFEYLEDLQGALERREPVTLSRLTMPLHHCHMLRLTGSAKTRSGICGALTRVLPRSTSFGYTVSALHDRIYRSNPKVHYRHLFLGAMAARRNRNFAAYREKMTEFILLHSDTHLIDDANTELGWYYLHTKDLSQAETYLRRVLDNYRHMNAYDNALYWLEKVHEAREDIPEALQNSAELAAYLATRRVVEKATGTHQELRSRIPEVLDVGGKDALAGHQTARPL